LLFQNPFPIFPTDLKNEVVVQTTSPSKRNGHKTTTQYRLRPNRTATKDNKERQSSNKLTDNYCIAINNIQQAEFGIDEALRDNTKTKLSRQQKNSTYGRMPPSHPFWIEFQVQNRLLG
jgi:hypothetical protein